jgi:hypothetical protein
LEQNCIKQTFYIIPCLDKSPSLFLLYLHDQVAVLRCTIGQTGVTHSYLLTGDDGLSKFPKMWHSISHMEDVIYYVFDKIK